MASSVGIVLGLGLCSGFGTEALAGDMPQYSDDKHLGVGECAGGPCHGSATPVGDRVNENEHTIWLRQDPHAEAYKTLLTEESRAIARNYGLSKPAHESEACLDCHADNAVARGPDLTMEEGVGCEACHGGAERWIKTHTSSQRKHEDNLRMGMFPTDDPVRRAELCLSCHFGTERRWVNHRMMGAGHPRLRFELDSYQFDQPKHFVVDDDYTERGKAAVEPVKLWAVGQAVQTRELLRTIADPKRNRDGIWPEFAVLDCYTCHHAMQDKRRPTSRISGLGQRPGTPRINDSGFLMLRHILEGVSPSAAKKVREGTRRMHAAMSKSEGNRANVAKDLADLIDSDALPAIASWDVGASSIQRIAVSLIDEGLDNQYADYPSAEQAAVALQSLADTLNGLRPFTRNEMNGINACLQDLLQATRDGDLFQTRAGGFTGALNCAKGFLSRD